MIEPEPKETASQRVDRCDAELAGWRAAGAAYLVLFSNRGTAAVMPGKLRSALAHLRRHDPKAEILELCDPGCRELFIMWALQRPDTKGNN